MNHYFGKKRTRLPSRILSAFVTFTFIFSIVISPISTYAQITPETVLNLPIPGTMVHLSPGFTPTLIKGITIHPENPLEFDFIVDTGDTKVTGVHLRSESNKLIKYFLASLTLPEEELWVNLSPYEKDRIIPNTLSETEMGRDLLAQDYILKQLTASLMYPEDALGQEFWNRVYTKANQMYGTTDIPMNTFNKIWIVPKDAVVFEHESSAYVVQSQLKVMLEEDYVALQKNKGIEKYGMEQLLESDVEIVSGLTSEIVREVLIPEIEKEVNRGKTFAHLRQIYNSMILAAWYKQNLKESLLGQVYIDKNKTAGIDIEDKQIKEKIFNQYVESFKKGVFNYIREDHNPVTQESIPRKYFSGGVDVAMLTSKVMVSITPEEIRQGSRFTTEYSSLSAEDARHIIRDGLPKAEDGNIFTAEISLKEVGAKADQAALAELRDSFARQGRVQDASDKALLVKQQKELQVGQRVKGLYGTGTITNIQMHYSTGEIERVSVQMDSGFTATYNRKKDIGNLRITDEPPVKVAKTEDDVKKILDSISHLQTTEKNLGIPAGSPWKGFSPIATRNQELADQLDLAVRSLFKQGRNSMVHGVKLSSVSGEKVGIEVLLTIMLQGVVRPPLGYSGVSTGLLDGDFKGPEYSYLAGDYGPYYIVLSNEASDYLKDEYPDYFNPDVLFYGEPLWLGPLLYENHAQYIVPTEMDREYLQAGLTEALRLGLINERYAELTMAKIVSIKEFSQMEKDEAMLVSVEDFLAAKLRGMGGNLVIQADDLKGPGTKLRDIGLTPETLEKLYQTAHYHHQGQERKNMLETDYLAHILGDVAIYVYKLGIRDANAIAAAFLHDSLEDSIDYFKVVSEEEITDENVKGIRKSLKEHAKRVRNEETRKRVKERIGRQLADTDLDFDLVFAYVEAMTKEDGKDLLETYFPYLLNLGQEFAKKTGRNLTRDQIDEISNNAVALKLADRIYNLGDLKHAISPDFPHDYIFGKSKEDPGTIVEYMEAKMGDRRVSFLESLPSSMNHVKIQFKMTLLQSLLDNIELGKSMGYERIKIGEIKSEKDYVDPVDKIKEVIERVDKTITVKGDTVEEMLKSAIDSLEDESMLSEAEKEAKIWLGALTPEALEIVQKGLEEKVLKYSEGDASSIFREQYQIITAKIKELIPTIEGRFFTVESDGLESEVQMDIANSTLEFVLFDSEGHFRPVEVRGSIIQYINKSKKDVAVFSRKNQEVRASTTRKIMQANLGEPVGGIDLNPALLDLQIKRDGKGVPLPLPHQPIESMNIKGFLPIIINITPMTTNMPILSEIMEEKQNEQEQYLKEAQLDPFDKKAKEVFDNI